MNSNQTFRALAEILPTAPVATVVRIIDLMEQASSHEVDEVAVFLLGQNRKIQAIKRHRSMTGQNRRESKDAVEAVRQRVERVVNAEYPQFVSESYSNY